VLKKQAAVPLLLKKTGTLRNQKPEAPFRDRKHSAPANLTPHALASLPAITLNDEEILFAPPPAMCRTISIDEHEHDLHPDTVLSKARARSTTPKIIRPNTPRKGAKSVDFLKPFLHLKKEDFSDFAQRNMRLIYEGFYNPRTSLSPRPTGERCFELYRSAASPNTIIPNEPDLLVLGSGGIWRNAALLKKFGKVTASPKPHAIGSIMVEFPYCKFFNLAFLLGGIEACKRFLIIGKTTNRLREALKAGEDTGLKAEIAVLLEAGYTLRKDIINGNRVFYAKPPKVLSPKRAECIGAFYTIFTSCKDRDFSACVPGA
jgi:hypothetical protein